MKKIVITILLCMNIYPFMQGMELSKSELPKDGMVRIFAKSASIDVAQDIACRIPAFEQNAKVLFFDLPYAQTEEDIKCAVSYALIPIFPEQEQAFVNTLAELDLQALTRRTIMIAKTWNQEKIVPDIFALAWSHQLNENKQGIIDIAQQMSLCGYPLDDSKLDENPLIKSIMALQNQDHLAEFAHSIYAQSKDSSRDHLAPLLSYTLKLDCINLSKEQISSFGGALHNTKFEDVIWLRCGNSNTWQKMTHFSKDYAQTIPYLDNMSKGIANFNLLNYQEATFDDIKNLAMYIEYHHFVSLDSSLNGPYITQIICLKRELDAALGFEALVKLTIMAKHLYQKFPEHLTKFWNFWRSDRLKSMDEETFIQNYFSGSGNRDLGKDVYARFIKEKQNEIEAMQKPEEKKQPEISPKNQFFFITFFKSCMEYKKTIISLVIFGGFAGHLSGMFNIFNLLNNLKYQK